MLSMRMTFTPEQQIFMIEPYFSNGHKVTHFTHFEKVTVFRRSARPKVHTEENIEIVKRRRRTLIISQATVAAD
jgi:hypothetical protein